VPSLAAQRGGLGLLETGLKAIDLLAPRAHGGKAGLIGGAANRPAVEVGLSVARVGGKAQSALLRKLAGICGCFTHSCTNWKRSRGSALNWNRKRAAGWNGAAAARNTQTAAPHSLALGARSGHAVCHSRGLLDPLMVAQVSGLLAALRPQLEEIEPARLNDLDQADELSGALEAKLRQTTTALQRTFQVRSAG
jgi:F0F1-type ATP synthase alpha subunit